MVAGEILKIFTHQDHNFLTASIPVHRLEVHVGRLVAAGYKVGIVSQTETAALKAAGTNRNVPFTRKLTALYTRSTMIGLDSGDLAEENSSVSMVTNYLVCIYDNGSKKGVQEHQLGLVAVQPSTGDVIYDCFLDSGARPELETRLSHIQPVEVLLSTDVSMETENAVKSLQIVSEQGEDKMRVEKLNFERFEQSYSFRKLNSFYKTVQALDFILELPKPVQCCLGALIEYLEDFNLQSTLSDVSLFTKFSTLTETMQLDSRVLHNLEVFVNQTDGSERGSLFSMVNHTQTKAGARLLKTWLAKPLINYSEIMKRQEAVKHLVECDLEETEGWSSALRNLPDLEQKLMSAFLKKIKPADFYNMCVALETVRSEFAKKRSKSQRHVTSHLLSNYLTNVPDLLSDVGHIVESLNGKAAKSFSTCYQRFRQAVRCLAELDCLLSLATVGRQQGYTRPIMVENDLVIDVTKGGHPVVQSLLSETGQYVYNDTHLQAGDRRVMLITGPNMGGKSCYIRQVALFVLLAQMGSYVPAEAARIGVFDGIYTRMGAKDDIFRGQSTFMTELVETSDIMSKVTDRSLVILDELGRGTSTHDGMAIAYAALDHFIKKSQCFLLFVTHYPMLAEFEALFPQTVTNHHMAFYMVANDDSDSEDLSQVVFLYQLVEGKASRSYGLNVARLAGLPQCIVTSARQLSHGMEERELTHRKQVELFQNLMCNPGLDVRHVLGEKKSADLKR
ncbi:DNA mismatch repair protein Msh3-like isoform X2 [Dreissena polymorpha]|uniref:DNA mismatch repair protein Msh3-like isoform X2 n=1 Tax=Dreissena polymorpha TaxID=45954 RepID=UPI0022645D55|nr:DNA mismatch repair protein Msh3-like isoform X2 [Dreissena polymorpha]